MIEIAEREKRGSGEEEIFEKNNYWNVPKWIPDNHRSRKLEKYQTG